MKKRTVLICFLVLAIMSIVVMAMPVSNEQACKMLGDFTDSQEWDVELEYLEGTHIGGELTCMDPVDGRIYVANEGAMSIVFEQYADKFK